MALLCNIGRVSKAQRGARSSGCLGVFAREQMSRLIWAERRAVLCHRKHGSSPQREVVWSAQTWEATPRKSRVSLVLPLTSDTLSCRLAQKQGALVVFFCLRPLPQI